MEWIDISDGAYKFQSFTRGDLEALYSLFKNGIISRKDFVEMLPVTIDQVDYSTFLVQHGIIEEPIDNRFEILDL